MNGFTTITTLTVAPEHPSAQEDDHISDEWKSLLQPLVRARGYYAGVLGRCIEQAAKVLILVVWDDRETWSQFDSSQEGQALERTLREAAQDTPHTLQISSFNRTLHYHGMGEIPKSAAEIHFIDFPHGSRSSVGNELQRARGMTVSVGYGINGARPEIAAKYPSFSQPLFGWVDDAQADNRDDESVHRDQAIWIHTWKSPEAERAFKESRSDWVLGEAVDAEGTLAPRLPIEEAFLKGLEKLGGARVVAEHFNFFRIL